MIEDSLILTTFQLSKELPVPVEFVLIDHDVEPKHQLSHDTRHVRFDEHLQMHEIARVTKRDQHLLWYSAKEYLAMQREAGLFLFPSAKRVKDGRTLRFRKTTTRIQQCLLLGSLIMGILVTETLTHRHFFNRRER